MNYDVKEVEMSLILSDSDFNCRGPILPLDVVDLAKDIERNTLQFPITVQPCDVDGYDFRIIAGHRRYAAFKVLKKTIIPVMIRKNLTELNARLLNLSENLKRKELNIMQEASAIKRLRDLGMTQEAIALELGTSRTWVQVRFHLLDLPVPIQDEAASGLLNQYQIRQIHGIDSKEDQFEAVRKIKTARLNGERNIDVGKTSVEKPYVKKRQTVTSVQTMIEHLGTTVGFGLHTRVLAWANGQINSAELYFDIKREAEKLGIDYRIPFLEKTHV